METAVAGDCGEKARIVIIQGPTASGKSELAIRLAEQIDGEIVNADSMQVYRGMDIGTAKPSPAMQQRVPHHLIDIVDPDVNFTAADFQRRASEAIDSIQRRGKHPIVVGGTGLYIRALLYGLMESPAGDEEYRRELKALAARAGNESVHRLLAAVDPATAAVLHPNDLVRIMRALEVFRQTGRPISALRQEHGFSGDQYRTLKLGIRVERQELYRRIEQRVDRMMEDGLEHEVSRLLAAGFHADLKAMRAIGYRQICAYLAGSVPLEEAIALIKQETRHYAKRQDTWFKRDAEISWVDYQKSFASIVNYVIDFLSKGVCYGKSTIQHPGSVSEPVP